MDAVQADHFLQEEQHVGEPKDGTEVVQDVTHPVDKSCAPWQCRTFGHLAPWQKRRVWLEGGQSNMKCIQAPLHPLILFSAAKSIFTPFAFLRLHRNARRPQICKKKARKKPEVERLWSRIILMVSSRTFLIDDPCGRVSHSQVLTAHHSTTTPDPRFAISETVVTRDPKQKPQEEA